MISHVYSTYKLKPIYLTIRIIYLMFKVTWIVDLIRSIKFMRLILKPYIGYDSFCFSKISAIF